MKKNICSIVGVLIAVFSLYNIWFSSKGDIVETGYNTAAPEEFAYQTTTSVSQSLYGREILASTQGPVKTRLLRLLAFSFGQMEDTSEAIAFSFADEEGVFYESKITMAAIVPDDWVELYLNIPISLDRQYTITLESEDPNIPFTIKTAKSNAMDESAEYLPIFRYGIVLPYEIPVNIARSLTVLLLLCTYLGMLWNARECRTRCAMQIAHILEALHRLPVLYVLIPEILLGAYVLEASGLELQAALKTALYLLSAFSAGWLHQKGYHRAQECIKDQLSAKIFAALVIYSAFSVFGNKLFIVPLTSHWSYVDIISHSFVLLLAALWIAPIIMVLLLWCMRHYRATDITSTMSRHTRHPWHLYVFSAVIFLLPLAVMLYAYNPAISVWDTAYCLSWVPDLHGMLNWQPPFYVAVLQALLGVWNSLYCLVFAQWLLWLYVWIEMLAFLRKRGVRDDILYAATVFMACNIPVLLQLCSLWKDTPYAILLLWVTLIIARLIWAKEDAANKIFVYIELSVSLLLLCLIRQNGIVPYIMVTLALGILCHKNKRLIVSLVVSALCVFMILGPYYNYYLQITPMEPASKFAALEQDMMSVYFYDGDVPQEVVSLANKRLQNDLNAGKVSFMADWAGGTYDFPLSFSDVFTMYVKTLAQNPLQLMRTVLFRSDHIWDIWGSEFNREGLCTWTETSESVFPEVWEIYEKRVPNALTEKLSVLINYTYENQALHALVWRIGPYTLLFLVLLTVHGMKRFPLESWLPFLPLIGHIIGIVLSAGWSERRYFWPIMLVTVFILLCTMGPTRKEASKGSDDMPQGTTK